MPADTFILAKPFSWILKTQSSFPNANERSAGESKADNIYYLPKKSELIQKKRIIEHNDNI